MELWVVFQLFFYAVCGDFVTGIMAAAKEGRLKSRRCSNGMFRTMGELFLLFAAVVVAKLIPAIEEIVLAMMLGILFKEGISICENLIRLDVWLPQSLIRYLEVGKDKIDQGCIIDESKTNSAN